ncbi:response regulator transcription factor [Aequorivita sp. SDUM287046]|uniref:Response regulator transcription factor n=1 Tax=Aequorivita aurantiaca TaxID=3053356 RepID=A0ABT8DN10_9FLAO|nr:response regulator transcription factor [Aequorivita aurantiaca]MDN3725389.1 response regulator transcription factor [Aequorivita aurantiaca]
MANEMINVLIVDDHQLMIEGLKPLLEDEEGIGKVSGANSMKEALDFLEKNQIEVILMDVNMPDVSGIEATKNIKARYHSIKIIALTMHDDIAIITKMIKAGASGYILKRTNMIEVVEAIKIVHNNGRYISKNIQNILMDNLMDPTEDLFSTEEKKPILSEREQEVLELLAKELKNDEIAEKLFISERTVEAHRRNIFIKTKTKSVIGLMKYVIKHGLIKINIEGK